MCGLNLVRARTNPPVASKGPRPSAARGGSSARKSTPRPAADGVPGVGKSNPRFQPKAHVRGDCRFQPRLSRKGPTPSCPVAVERAGRSRRLELHPEPPATTDIKAGQALSGLSSPSESRAATRWYRSAQRTPDAHPTPAWVGLATRPASVVEASVLPGVRAAVQSAARRRTVTTLAVEEIVKCRAAGPISGGRRRTAVARLA